MLEYTEKNETNPQCNSINKYVCTQSHSTSDGELKRLIDMAADYMTGMTLIFVSHLTAGNMHCKINQSEKEHCRDSKYLLKTGLHAPKSEAMEERSTVCVPLVYL